MYKNFLLKLKTRIWFNLAIKIFILQFLQYTTNLKIWLKQPYIVTLIQTAHLEMSIVDSGIAVPVSFLITASIFSTVSLTTASTGSAGAFSAINQDDLWLSSKLQELLLGLHSINKGFLNSLRQEPAFARFCSPRDESFKKK